ncbi:CDP-glucose 4,6-dehydratase [Paenibacillus sp. UMB4589-SE434]|uniref:CDP-glucose 4,6-dehydratase n=1 Tax=Paenibacillus sp. UMB4589-SE434 TaxID=3046314 RepID=UPI00254A6CAA|nr:CDP-glucose 4,6-dehydratase [Paenibacillus sp. UMB4589-SE434]MDK8183527.1 CDP-glucose 4,6-dehydratase [Paenibacillus sp. UMB4589-SE434]
MMKSGRVDRSFWRGKNVFLTGHTGFKGGWLSLWLHSMGANVTGYSLSAPTTPSLFELSKLENVLIRSIIGDVTDLGLLQESLIESNPDIIIHMAAQPLVRKSYEEPVQTYMTNVMGTVNIMEAARSCSSLRVILNVTTDKCYENQEWHWGYRENEPLGGYDPYSSSKACSELITSAYRRSFLQTTDVRVATARAGNVIGGGDWAEDRLIPDLIRALINGDQIEIRNPKAVRPWQHVLEPLSGYLLLCQRLYLQGKEYAQAWNFGPQESDAKPVEWIVNQMLKKWPHQHPGYLVNKQEQCHEANMLKLDCSKAFLELGWTPRWSLDQALDATIQWVDGYLRGMNIKELCEQQIREFEMYEDAIQ